MYNSHKEEGFLLLHHLRTSLFNAITLHSQYQLSINSEIRNQLESYGTAQVWPAIVLMDLWSKYNYKPVRILHQWFTLIP